MANTHQNIRVSKKKKELAREVASRINARYAGVRQDDYLVFDNPYQCVIAVLLSAQTTDKSVNKVTPELFKKYPTVFSLANANVEDVEQIIKSIGIYKTKAKRAVECAQTLVENFGGEVPKTIEELMSLPGVGRKTANVVLTDAFGVAHGIAVDTHVGRIARRLGFTKSQSPVEVEQVLLKTFDECEWPYINKRWIAFGREICKAQNPLCEVCFLADVCPSCPSMQSKCKAK